MFLFSSVMDFPESQFYIHLLMNSSREGLIEIIVIITATCRGAEGVQRVCCYLGLSLEESMQNFLARIKDGAEQSLQDHSENVSNLSENLSFYKKISSLIGKLHDIGKAVGKFQDYLKGAGKRGDVYHSIQGVFFFDDIVGDSFLCLKELVALVIAAHHGSLDDGIAPDGRKLFIEKLHDKENVKYHYSELKDNVPEEFIKHIVNIASDANGEIGEIFSLINKEYSCPRSANYALGLFVKYFYSCLIDADRLDAYLFEVNEKYSPVIENWDGLISVFERNIIELQSSEVTPISKIRLTVSDKCKEAAKRENGIYQLAVPTGGGKTFSSLRFALHHCKIWNKKRIIYVIPFLSIIEQAASSIRDILGLQEENDVILEHHSNIVPLDNEDERENKLRNLSTSRWDKKIVITTMVQFLETVMSSRGSNLRKFHNMSDAVIIFDEIQALPIKTVYLFNETVSFLAKMMNSTILLCSATQPLLHKTERENLLLEENYKLFDCDGLFSQIRRTAVVYETEMDMNEFSDFVLKKARLEQNGNCLAIVNSKKAARDIFRCLKELADEEEFEILHLSTAMCSEHRGDTLYKIKTALDKNQKIICITTQLIEAGVDISFSCVVRASAGLDSIIQAAGRCNRNGESENEKDVYVVPLKGENLDKLEDIKSGKEITEKMFREHKGKDLTDEFIVDQFYTSYFYERRGLMDYPLSDGTSIYDMLSVNKSGRNKYRNRTGQEAPCYFGQAFRTADEEFYVIENNTESVVVMYGIAESLIDNYHEEPRAIFTKGKLQIIRQLEKLSVSLFPHEYKKLSELGAIGMLDDEIGIKYLIKGYYSEEIGVNMEGEPQDYII